MNDLISRRKAFGYFVTLWECIGTIMDRNEWEDVCMTTANEIPSAQPERKKGEWIPEFDGKFTGGAYWFSCSKCKRIVPEVRNGGWNFCPQCGADMRGEQDG